MRYVGEFSYWCLSRLRSPQPLLFPAESCILPCLNKKIHSLSYHSLPFPRHCRIASTACPHIWGSLETETSTPPEYHHRSRYPIHAHPKYLSPIPSRAYLFCTKLPLLGEVPGWAQTNAQNLGALLSSPFCSVLGTLSQVPPLEACIYARGPSVPRHLAKPLAPADSPGFHASLLQLVGDCESLSRSLTPPAPVSVGHVRRLVGSATLP